jgi:signal peptidase II
MSAPERPRSWQAWFLPALAGVVVLDQLSKWLIFSLPKSAALPSYLARAYNTGVAWSIGRGHPLLWVLVTSVLIPVLSAMWWLYFRHQGRGENLAFGLIIGGALGNAVDRCCAVFGWFSLAGVRDFISVDLGFAPFHPFPTFNIADSGITVGFMLLVLLSFLRPAAAATPPQAAQNR